LKSIRTADSAFFPNVHVEEPKLFARSVATALESAIIYGELPDGLRLREEIICKKMGVSRSPVREAMRILERDGLLIREPRRGVRVSELTIEDLDELYACRVALEDMAVRLAVRVATDEEIAAIARCHAECSRLFGSGDLRGHFDANVEMSEMIFRSAHNRPLMRLKDTIHKQALRYRFFAYQNSQDFRQSSVKGNSRFLAALIRRDADTAVDSVRELITMSHHLIRACLLKRNALAADER
jgi:DNA-binding GntR family transcriptional regulator